MTKFIIQYNLQISPVKDWKKNKNCAKLCEIYYDPHDTKSTTNFEQNCIFTFSIDILFVCWMEWGIKSDNFLQ